MKMKEFGPRGRGHMSLAPPPLHPPNPMDPPLACRRVFVKVDYKTVRGLRGESLEVRHHLPTPKTLVDPRGRYG